MMLRERNFWIRRGLNKILGRDLPADRLAQERVSQNPGHHGEAQPSVNGEALPANEAGPADPRPIAVFDCWTRKFVDAESPFLKNGAAVIRVRGTPELERANKITFVVEYANGQSEPLTAPLTDKSKPAVNAQTRFKRNVNRGTIVRCVVLSTARNGFEIETERYKAQGDVHISNVPQRRHGEVYKKTKRGRRFNVKYLATRRRLQFSLHNVNNNLGPVKVPSEDGR